MKPAAWRFARVCAWTCKTPLTRAGATSRRHHPNPAEAQGALAGTTFLSSSLTWPATQSGLCEPRTVRLAIRARKEKPRVSVWSRGIVERLEGGRGSRDTASVRVADPRQVRERAAG